MYVIHVCPALQIMGQCSSMKECIYQLFSVILELFVIFLLVHLIYELCYNSFHFFRTAVNVIAVHSSIIQEFCKLANVHLGPIKTKKIRRKIISFPFFKITQHSIFPPRLSLFIHHLQHFAPLLDRFADLLLAERLLFLALALCLCVSHCSLSLFIFEYIYIGLMTRKMPSL